jgi:hypothetical protein
VTGEGYTGFWWGNLRKRNQCEDLGVDEDIILKWIFEKWDATCVDMIDLLEKDKWRFFFVNSSTNLRVP